MFIRSVNTWTLCVLFPLLITRFSLGASLGETNASPTSMYDALVNKCPNLETSVLKNNEIASKRCLNWAEINATDSVPNPIKENIECLLFYESLVSFCTSMGDNLPKVQDIIPSAAELQRYNYSLDKVCLGKYSLYPVNKTEHNISSLIKTGSDCFFLCTDVASTFKNKQVSDVCKFSYYFTNFDVNKFTHDLKTWKDQQKESDSNTVQLAKTDEKPVVKNATAEVANNMKQLPVQTETTTVKRPVVKPQQTENDNQAGLVQNNIPETDNNKFIKQQIEVDSKVNVPKSAEEKPAPKIKEKPAEVPETKDGKGGDSAFLPDQQAKADVNKEDGQPESAPEKEKQPETHIENPQPELEGIPEYENDDKPVNVDGTDQDILDDNDVEVEQDDVNIGPNAVKPEQKNEQKTSAKKVKPSTVEDEGVSFTNPEDDMDGDSYFFSYFTVIMCLFIVGYVGYHNRQKILALLLEGKKGRRTGRSRRPNSANYHKLDTNLEEAISSSCTKNASNVIY